MQGDGCTERNLISLVRHIMELPSFDVVVDLLLQAIKKRRDSCRNPFPFQYDTLPSDGAQLESHFPLGITILFVTTILTDLFVFSI